MVREIAVSNHSTVTGGPAAMIFIDNKYTRWYYAIIQRAQRRASTRNQAKEILGYVEQHHIIPESFYIERKRKGRKGWLPGDPNSADNLVFLTAKEHFTCHHLLIKMVTTKGLESVKRAFVGMCFLRNQKCKISSTQYQHAKQIASKLITEMNKNRPPISEETRRKLSISSQRQKGKTLSEETKQRIRESKKNISQETRDKISAARTGRKTGKPAWNHGKPAWNRGKSWTNDIKQNIKNGFTEEVRNRIKLAKAKSDKVKIICDHCQKEVDRANYARHHGDRCKFKNYQHQSNHNEIQEDRVVSNNSE